MLVNWSLKDAYVVVVGDGNNAAKRVAMLQEQGVKQVLWFKTLEAASSIAPKPSYTTSYSSAYSSSSSSYAWGAPASTGGSFSFSKPTVAEADAAAAAAAAAAKKPYYVQNGNVQEYDFSSLRIPESLQEMGSPERMNVVDAVFAVNEQKVKMDSLAKTCRRLRIPFNNAESCSYNTFNIPATWSEGPLQLALSTSRNGCRLAQRLLRHVVSTLPVEMPAAVQTYGKVRSLTQEDAQKSKWLSQITDYWPLEKISKLTEDDYHAVLDDEKTLTHPPIYTASAFKPSKKGQIVLVGSGPGNPDLLTVAAREAIQRAHFVLADKLVPGPVLRLIPRHTPVFIARKFPGNASNAQDELHELALEALEQGQYVVRLKQGDPFIFGRGGEEVLFFKKHGYSPQIIPGISSAMVAPAVAGIPMTHRGIADRFLICTGTGKNESSPEIPPFVAKQTVVFLMSLHKLRSLTESLISNGYPSITPVCIVERATCADERFIRGTIESIADIYEDIPDHRPPGLLVVGFACSAFGITEGSIDKKENIVEPSNVAKEDVAKKDVVTKDNVIQNDNSVKKETAALAGSS
ncbi:uroporphyrin methyltransferase [Schizosaccharomyces japonicus yFS275]|uniref:uroporphyrinogen-III C-methyltransferase n=1 Tax=Schizosaccharomyces japonicus (strain yFS275 / FY16936) TaxID=402676 RepID=B6K003_SCHJY|nr:uroporphyrin methyltransferase [Schizosaccharomyces japonicus yFS275]EEB06153.2 uroporphyrin methyltransferase [Schizosaccharomyces japonicus yFS275]